VDREDEVGTWHEDYQRGVGLRPRPTITETGVEFDFTLPADEIGVSEFQPAAFQPDKPAPVGLWAQIRRWISG
jgi:hypothetical protein